MKFMFVGEDSQSVN